MRILVFYSNTLEDPGVIANSTLGSSQLDFLRAALQRVKKEQYKGALLFAHHHPPYTVGGQHSSSTQMRQQMDAICTAAEVWPHAVLAGHAHSYQRYTRHRADGTEIPYIICGNGGHNVQKLQTLNGVPLRTPQPVVSKLPTEDAVVLENYDDLAADPGAQSSPSLSGDDMAGTRAVDFRLYAFGTFAPRFRNSVTRKPRVGAAARWKTSPLGR